MTVRRFLRSVSVTVGDAQQAVRVEDLLLSFRFRREATSTPADGHVDIYNLTEDNEARIHERAVRVLLEAGYQNTRETLFDARVRRVERQRVNLDRITRIHVGGQTTPGEQAAEPRRAIFMRTYEGTISVRDIVRDGVATLGLDLGSMDLIPADAVETDFRYNGPTQDMLTHRLRPLGIEWYEDNGLIKFSRFAMSADDRDGVVVSEKTGMIGTPTVTDDGIRVATLLDARMQIDTLIRVDSVIETSNRLWKIVELEHSGDNREGIYQTIVEARPVQ